MADKTTKKQTSLAKLGGQFKQAREELGYNVTDLNDHTGLTSDELKALENGDFHLIEQQDYLDYYVHTYAALLGLDADPLLQHFQELFHGHVPDNVNIHDEDQYDVAFADEAKKTLKALDTSNSDVPQDVEKFTLPSLETDNLKKDDLHSPIGSISQQKPFPWIKLLLAFIIVIASAIGIYYLVNSQFNVPQNTVNTATDKPDKATGKSVNTTDSASETVSDNAKTEDRLPDAQKAKKIGNLESKIINKGSDDLNAPTAINSQKPLILPNSSAIKPTATVKLDNNTTADAIKEVINKVIINPNNGSQASGTSVAKETAAVSQDLPTSTKKTALEQLPTDQSKYSLLALKNSWILIEDDASQILFSGELTPNKLVTLPKIKGVIISLGDAGVIDVYKGKTLIGKLGKTGESLDLVSLEQRFNQLTN